MRTILLTMGLVGTVLLAGAPGARADDQSGDWQDQFNFRLEGFDKLMQGMDDLLESIPRFEAPYIDEDGDIIIRRAPRERQFDPFTRPVEPEFADI